MKIIPRFKPSINYKQLNTILLRLLFGNSPEQAISVFEQKFARYLNVKYAIRVPSARWGLYYILKNLDLAKGDEVIIPAFTYFAVAAAVIKLGLKPVFVDINSRNFNIDVEKIKKNISERTRVIIPTHLCGFACEFEEILNIAQKHNIKLIEDCAQSLGAEYKNKKVGSWGDASYFTFGITKNFTTLGGGMIATNNDELADRIRREIITIRQTSNKLLFLRLLKAYIMKFATSSILFPIVYWTIRIFSYFDTDIVDVIFREKKLLLENLPKGNQLNNIQAELGLAQLNDLDRKNEMRMEKGLELYRKVQDVDSARTALLVEKAKNIFSGCPILVKNKKDVKRMLLRKGIDVSAGYMQDCSRLDVFNEFQKNCPNASRAKDEILYFPIYPELTDSELMYMIGAIKQLASQFTTKKFR